MPKKFVGENSKAVEARARKAAVKKVRSDCLNLFNHL
jgi:hypothetical protein